MHACRNIHETRRVGLYIKGVSHGFVQMVYNCLDLFLISFLRQTSGSFNGIWSDMGTEKTIIKDSKGSGGIVGITNQKSALVRWILTRHFLASFSSANIFDEDIRCADQSPSRSARTFDNII
jgi:hypothetical protein